MSEKASRRFWVSMILGFFAIDITVAVVAISMAAGDPSFRPIPGFSDRSVYWAETQKKQKNLLDLGWKIEVDPSATHASQLAIRVLDKQGQPVSDAEFNVTVFHYTRVAEQQTAKMVESDGIYTASFDLAKSGNWNLDILGKAASGEDTWSQIRLVRE